jgi:hypothetical protein
MSAAGGEAGVSVENSVTASSSEHLPDTRPGHAAAAEHVVSGLRGWPPVREGTFSAAPERQEEDLAKIELGRRMNRFIDLYAGDQGSEMPKGQLGTPSKPTTDSKGQEDTPVQTTGTQQTTVAQAAAPVPQPDTPAARQDTRASPQDTQASQ